MGRTVPDTDLGQRPGGVWGALGCHTPGCRGSRVGRMSPPCPVMALLCPGRSQPGVRGGQGMLPALG